MEKKLMIDRISEQNFFVQFAKTFSQWQFVEYELARCFMYLIGPDRMHRTASDAYYSVINFNTKLTMTNASMRVALQVEPQLLTKWEKLYNRIERTSRLRNRLAHYRLIYIPNADGRLVPILESWPPNDKGQISEKLLINWHKQFLTLGTDLKIFVAALWASGIVRPRRSIRL